MENLLGILRKFHQHPELAWREFWTTCEIATHLKQMGYDLILGKEFILVTPGIRLPTDAVGDQKRIVSPADAVRQGSDYLVIGRPITQADDPIQKLLTINSDISQL